MENSIKTLEVIPATASNGHLSSPFIGTPAGPQSLSIERLRAELKGRVITPEDADYEAVRIGLSREVVRRPALIVRPVDASDVSHVVSLTDMLMLLCYVRYQTVR
jgi:hypothetical protein